LTCGLNYRFRAEAQALKRFVDAGYLGEVYYARAQARRPRAEAAALHEACLFAKQISA